MQADVEKQFAERVAKLFSAAAELSRFWEQVDHTGSYWVSGYPFTESLDEVVAKIAHWQQICEGKTPEPLPPVCTKTWFTDGGRTEKQCGEPAALVCTQCGEARCDGHDDLDFEEMDGKLVCEDCRP